MNKNEKNVVTIEVTGFQAACRELGKLKDENEKLKADNKVLGDELTYFKGYAADLEEEVADIKARCRKLNARNMQLESEVKDSHFIDSTFMKAELAAEAHEAELVSAMGSYLGDDF